MIATVNQNWSKIRLNHAQKVLTAEQIRKLPDLYDQDGKGLKAIAYVKFFAGPMTWFATEFDAEAGMFFGYAHNAADPHGSELGYFSAAELTEARHQRVRVNGQIRVISYHVERDLHFKPQPLESALASLNR